MFSGPNAACQRLRRVVSAGQVAEIEAQFLRAVRFTEQDQVGECPRLRVEDAPAAALVVER
jgi:hypothetical protein